LKKGFIMGEKLDAIRAKHAAAREERRSARAARLAGIGFVWGDDEDSEPTFQDESWGSVAGSDISRAEFDRVVDRVMQKCKLIIQERAALEATGAMLDRQEAEILAQQARRYPAPITYSYRRGF